MTVVATCTDCGDEHSVAARSTDDSTAASTVCPVCDSPCYTSHCEDGYEDDIETLIGHVRGVGADTLAAIEARYDAYELRAADVDELCDVPYVGEKTAQRVVDAVRI